MGGWVEEWEGEWVEEWEVGKVKRRKGEKRREEGGTKGGDKREVKERKMGAGRRKRNIDKRLHHCY